MATVGYARVSTAGQDLTAQLDALSNCDRIFQEKASGSSATARPELQNMLLYVREGDTVVVTKLDRIARNTADLLSIVDQLEEKKVAFKVLNINLDTSTPTGKLMLTMLGAIATFERQLLLERQREGIEIAKAKGVYAGRKPTAMAKEKEVKELVSQGFKKAEIARKLGISVPSVYRCLS